MHNAALAAVGLSGWRYGRLGLAPEIAAETLRALPGAGFRGVNVTIPHKTLALTLADEVTARAQAIGAANTLLFDAEDRVRADNTDGPALAAILAGATASPPRSALVLGAGGSARAAVWALRDAGVSEVRIWNRTPARAAALAADMGAEAVTRAAPADVLVNCTAVGLHGEDPFTAGALPLRAGDVTGHELVVDLVYAPGGTRLLDAARAAGVAAVDGLQVLVGQGALSFTLFTGVAAPVAVMEAAARAVV